MGRLTTPSGGDAVNKLTPTLGEPPRLDKTWRLLVVTPGVCEVNPNWRADGERTRGEVG